MKLRVTEKLCLIDLSNLHIYIYMTLYIYIYIYIYIHIHIYILYIYDVVSDPFFSAMLRLTSDPLIFYFLVHIMIRNISMDILTFHITKNLALEYPNYLWKL